MKPKIGDSVRILEQQGAQVNIGDIGKIVGTTTYREQGGNEPYAVYLTVMEKPLAGFENFEWEFTEEAVESVEGTPKHKFKVGDRIKLIDSYNSLFLPGDTGVIHTLGNKHSEYDYEVVMDKDDIGWDRRWFFSERHMELLHPVQPLKTKSSKPVKYFLYYIDDSMSKIKSFDSKKELVSFCKAFAETPDFKNGDSWLEYVFKGYAAKIEVDSKISFEGVE